MGATKFASVATEKVSEQSLHVFVTFGVIDLPLPQHVILYQMDIQKMFICFNVLHFAIYRNHLKSGKVINWQYLITDLCGGKY